MLLKRPDVNAPRRNAGRHVRDAVGGGRIHQCCLTPYLDGFGDLAYFHHEVDAGYLIHGKCNPITGNRLEARGLGRNTTPSWLQE